MLTVDKFGRRPLLLIGVGGMFGSSLLIGIACQVAYSTAAATYITIVMLFIFVGSYQVYAPSPRHLHKLSADQVQHRESQSESTGCCS